jgi:coenzyme F420-reducing hydrogenase beta subunit
MKQCSRCKLTQPDDQFWIERRRNKLGSRCKSCSREVAREWRAKNPDAEKKRYKLNRQSVRERHLVKKYGVSLAEYERMFTEQGGKCAICKKQQTRSFDVDHCHSTGQVRGLLCTSCNRMVGHAGDDPERLIAAAAYLVPQQAAA